MNDDAAKKFAESVGEENWNNFLDSMTAWDPFVRQYAAMLEIIVMNEDWQLRTAVTPTPTEEPILLLLAQFYSEKVDGSVKEKFKQECLMNYVELPSDLRELFEKANWQISGFKKEGYMSFSFEMTFRGTKNFDYEKVSRKLIPLLSIIGVQPREHWIFADTKFGA